MAKNNVIKKAYFYLFYKIYHFGAKSGPFPNDFSSAAVICMLEVMILATLKFYYIGFIDRHDTLELYSFQTIVSLLTIFFINYFAFIDKKYTGYMDNNCCISRNID